MEDINEFLSNAIGYERQYRLQPEQIDFLTWEGFGKLWEWTKKQEWWLAFVKETTYIDNTQAEIDADLWHVKKGIQDFIDPATFAKAVANYLLTNNY